MLQMLTVGPFQENCYILGDESSGVGILIDPGDEPERIAFSVEGTGLEIERILLTHAHIDHVGAVVALGEEYSCPVAAHRDSEELLSALPTQAMMMGIRPGAVPEIDSYIEEEEVVEVGTLALRALYTPGHAPGHFAFYNENEGVVIDGDALFAGSVGRVDLPGGDGPRLLESIHQRLLTLPDNTEVHPGHGPATTIGTERETNPFLQEGVTL